METGVSELRSPEQLLSYHNHLVFKKSCKTLEAQEVLKRQLGEL
jgi:hypothetical protein